jgi:hypothetical protein
VNLPPFVYSLKFWEAASVITAAIAVQFFGVEYVDAGVVLVAVLGILRLFQITPELRAKGLIK